MLSLDGGSTRAGAALDRRHATSGQRLDLKAVRLATHGWWLGSPLVYKPGAPDLLAVARELASAGLASGALILDDTSRGAGKDASGPAVVRAALIIRPNAPRALLGMAAASAIAEVAESALGRTCAIAWPWDISLRLDGPANRAITRICRVSVQTDDADDAALVVLRFAFARLWAAHRAAQAAGVTPASPLFTRPDWREVFLARSLHTLDVHLRELAPDAEHATPGVEDGALRREWRRRLVAPSRVILYHRDGSRYIGAGSRVAADGSLALEQPQRPLRRISPDDVVAACGSGWETAQFV